MAKEPPSDRKEKKEHKKHKRSEEDGVKKHKKEKRERKHSPDDVDEKEAINGEGEHPVVAGTDVEKKSRSKSRKSEHDDEPRVYSVASFVPFAQPLADDKSLRKVLRGVKRASKRKTVKRGVKEVQKFLRKSGDTLPGSKTLPHAIVVLAADISPMDVISHLPVFCEDHGVPYIFVPSRAELGLAAGTKRPTSVVMVVRDVPAKKQALEPVKEGEESWEDSYADVAKVVEKAQSTLRI